jgi:Tol biopolymer transport system component
MDRRRWELVVGLAGLLLGLGVLLFWLSPRLVAYGPEGAAVSAAHPIQLQFSRSVNAELAERYLQIEPPTAGRIVSDGRTLQFLPDELWPPDEPITISVRRGWPGANGLPFWRGQSWRFTVGQPDVYFATFTAEGTAVWTLDPAGGEPSLWFSETGDIVDMNLTADGRALLLTLRDEDGRSLLIQHDRFPPQRRELLLCADAVCRQPQAQPGGELIAYERIVGAGAARQTQVWLLDRRSGDNQPAHSGGLFADPLLALELAAPVSHSPRWSPDGRTLAYFKPDVSLIILRDLSGDAPPGLIPAQLNEMGGWSPQGDSLIYTELTFDDPDFYERWEQAIISGDESEHLEPGLYHHVIRTDLVGGVTQDLSEGLAADESGPNWSPDGRRLAFSRSYGGAGRQLWLSDADGGNPTPLTDDPFYHHSAPRWSPDGRYILFMRSGLVPSGDPPAIWRAELATGRLAELYTGGFLPGWRP